MEKEHRPSHTPSFSPLQGGKLDLNTTLPIRQTASIFKQPVTKVTSHPGNKVKTDSQRAADQPKQVRSLHTFRCVGRAMLSHVIRSGTEATCCSEETNQQAVLMRHVKSNLTQTGRQI